LSRTDIDFLGDSSSLTPVDSTSGISADIDSSSENVILVNSTAAQTTQSESTSETKLLSEFTSNEPVLEPLTDGPESNLPVTPIARIFEAFSENQTNDYAPTSSSEIYWQYDVAATNSWAAFNLRWDVPLDFAALYGTIFKVGLALPTLVTAVAAEVPLIIELKDVWKIYKTDSMEFAALSGVNLDIFKGEFIAIMGSSGSGKSTFLNAIGALDVPTKGTIFLDQNNIANLSESELAQIRGRKIGFIFQAFNLVPSLSAIENVMLPMTFQGVSRGERIIRAAKLLDAVGLKEKINSLPNTLSGGQRQRVAIARSLSNNPEVILADEPTGNLDSKSGEEIIRLFQELNSRGITLIIVTHDQEIANHGKRIIRLKDGLVVADDRVTARSR